MKIVCCANMPLAREAFSTLGDILVKDGRQLTPADVRQAEVLAIRSTTQVNRRLLGGSRVRFVGTATIGTDHMDIPWLEQSGIRWCYAPGCNANSVAEYVTTALLCLSVRHGLSLAGKTLGVIGVGNVGSKVVQKGLALGMRVLRNDPPRAEKAGEQAGTAGGAAPLDQGPFVPLDVLLAESDVVTLHVPLTKTGSHATFGMAGEPFFRKMKPGTIFINSARGGVMSTDALLVAMDGGVVSHAVIDTWEGEPGFRPDLLKRADLGTPHIAGHSFEGKVMGTVMVYREACRFLGVEASWTHDSLMPAPLVPEVRLDAKGRRREEILWDIVRQVYDIEADDGRLRSGASQDDRGRACHFDQLRRQYPMRREFRFTRVVAADADVDTVRTLRSLEFGLPGVP